MFEYFEQNWLKNHECLKATDLRSLIIQPKKNIKRKRKRDQLRQEKIDELLELLHSKRIKIEGFLEVGTRDFIPDSLVEEDEEE